LKLTEVSSNLKHKQGFRVSTCPKCGATTVNFVALWPSAFTEAKGAEGKTQLLTGVFECRECKTKFRARVYSKKKEKQQRVNVKNSVEKIRDLRDGLMQTLRMLREKIQMLESEKRNLLEEVEALRKTAEARVTILEGEVNQMRQEVKALKELLSNNNTAPAQKS